MVLWLLRSPEHENIFKSFYASSYIIEYFKKNKIYVPHLEEFVYFKSLIRLRENSFPFSVPVHIFFKGLRITILPFWNTKHYFFNLQFLLGNFIIYLEAKGHMVW